MKPMTCGLLLVAVCAGGISPAHAQSSSRSLEGRRAAQNALFEEEYEAELKAYPERATAYGDYRYNDRLNDASTRRRCERTGTRQGLPEAPAGNRHDGL